VEDNYALVNKAVGDLTLGDLTGGGELVPEQLERYIQIMMDKPVVLGMSTFKTMSSFKLRLANSRFVGRVLRAGTSGQALPAGDRVKPDLNEVELDVKLLKGEIQIPDEVLEDQIEREQMRETVMELAAKATRRDVEDLIINGDITSADPYLALFDGLLAQATTNAVGFGTVRLSKAGFRLLDRLMPSEFMQDDSSMVYYTSKNAVIDYRDTLMDRATNMGDINIETKPKTYYSGKEVVSVPLFPENLGGGTNETNVLLLDPKNVCVGFHRNIRLETDRDISAGRLKLVVTLRMDAKYTFEGAVAKLTGVLAA